MSADNGIYIIKDKKGYRVAHCQAIDNIYWWEKEKDEWDKRDKINPKVADEYFGDVYYEAKAEALKEADRIYQEIMDSNYPIVEYGIQYLGEVLE